jgi:hypothetical protein
MPPQRGSSSHVVLRGSKSFHRAGAVVLGRSDRTERREITVKVSRQGNAKRNVDFSAKIINSFGDNAKA